MELGIRPEHFAAPGEGTADLTLELDVAEHLGAQSFLYAGTRSAEQIVVAHEAMSRADQQKREITVSIPARRAFVFTTDGRRIR